MLQLERVKRYPWKVAQDHDAYTSYPFMIGLGIALVTHLVLFLIFHITPYESPYEGLNVIPIHVQVIPCPSSAVSLPKMTEYISPEPSLPTPTLPRFLDPSYPLPFIHEDIEYEPLDLDFDDDRE